MCSIEGIIKRRKNRFYIYGFNTDCKSSEPLETFVKLCHLIIHLLHLNDTHLNSYFVPSWYTGIRT